MVRPYVVVQRPEPGPVQDFRAARATKRGYLLAGKRKLDEYAAQVKKWRDGRGTRWESLPVCVQAWSARERGQGGTANAFGGRRRLALSIFSTFSPRLPFQADEEAATHADRAPAGAPATVVNATPAKKAKHNVTGVGKV